MIGKTSHTFNQTAVISFKKLLTLILLVGFFQQGFAEPNPSKNYYPLSKLSDSGRLRLTIQSQTTPIPLNTLHHWILRITTSTGQPVKPLEILIDGSMPRHSHGLPTQPKVTRYLENGKYLIEGVQFHMQGVWRFHFKYLDENGWDQITFKLLVEPPKGESVKGWSESELAVLKSIWLESINDVPPDPSNTMADNIEAAKLGQKIFFDPAFSRNQKVSCATCHQPGRHFSDGKEQSKGLTKVSRNAPGLVGVAYNSWFYWDGRRDSLWAQALTPFEASQEMGLTRVGVLKIIAEQPKYNDAYIKLFGPLPNWVDKQKKSAVKPASPIGDEDEKSAWNTIPPRDKRAINTAFANIGKAIAAYERKLLPAPALFDRYVETLVNQGKEIQSILTPQQHAGLRLFIGGKAQCLTCHNGPLFTNRSFHNIGTGINIKKPHDMGRILGIQSVLIDEFNCRGLYTDFPQAACKKLLYINRQEIGALMNGAFKVPSLRNLAHTAPYMHDGRFASLMEVLKHYQKPPDNTQSIHEINRLNLSLQELENIVAFLLTLSGPMMTSPEWLEPPIDR